MKLMKTFSFLSESMRNVVIDDEFSVPTTIDKSIYITNSETKKIMKLNYRRHSNI